MISRRFALVTAVYLATFMAVLDISIVNVALPTLQTALNADLAGLQWVIDAYALCLSAFMLSAGPFSDRYGYKRCWLAGVALFTVSSGLCALAPNLTVLLVGRVAQGMAGALLIPGALSILSHAFPDPRSRAHAIGGLSSFSALSLILGPLLGGVLVDTVGWPSIFLLNLPLGVAVLILGGVSIPERRHPRHAALDPAGQFLAVLALGTLTFGLIAAGEHGWMHALPRYALLTALLGMIAFVWVESRVARPVLPLALFRHGEFSRANVASFVLGFSAYSSLFFFSLFLQRIQGHGPAEAGLRMMPQFVLSGLASILFGRLHQRFTLSTLLIAGYLLMGGAMTSMVLLDATTDYRWVGLLFALLGAGMGLAVPGTGLAVMNAVPPERAAIASAVINALRQTGMAVGIALMGSLMSTQAIRHLSAASGDPVLARQAVTGATPTSGVSAIATQLTAALGSGFHLAMAVAGAAALLTAALLLWARRTATVSEPAV
ncbi:EmrB/QacA subfamily drug resistance transporter [Alcanivorax xiamenensis]|uniref:EmrB/QacA subfamily drug resistance transporter n=1 Tax=Alcanivorax xiamenensis TaxID=1177156 RepID=A0ABQ6Y2K1_9GAMM|nr:DHA2 family efflux MFS transporter permease subunit [Alcanivorax xiamenensis]KAF0802363.1 EmrB/QacA subfamily drug resistance transporter [Alcanivorax xiamenensis]